ncbi:6-phosphogluconolactonase [Candidatus Gracilibacteria bacterium]|nr:6-phosphogluconolactonase [Candidatus Gracilibacteria bacterium]
MKITHSTSDITRWFFETLGTLLKIKSTVMIGLAGGTSLDGWYAELLQSSQWDTVDTSRIRWCVTDERVNCEQSDRNDVHIWDVFLNPLSQQGFTEEPYFVRSTIDSVGGDYTERVGVIDIAFFGMGPDGHTASLFPGHEALESNEIGFIKIDNAPKFPPERISLSPKSLQHLTHACLFAVGETKKEALANFLDDTIDVHHCPAKFLTPEIVFTDIV